MRIHVRQKNAAMVKINSNGEKRDIVHKVYGSYRKSKKSSEYGNARMRHTQNQRLSSGASRQSHKTKKMKLHRSTKENKS